MRLKYEVLWFIHHFRGLYDLWDSPYRLVPDNPSGRAIRSAVIDLDNGAIREPRAVYTNSQVVAGRLKHFNRIDAAPLYPPIIAPERFRNDGYGNEIVVICRVESHKRQWLLVEAMRHVKTEVKLRLCGTSMGRVIDGVNGFVVPADPVALAEAMDRLFVDRILTRRTRSRRRA